MQSKAGASTIAAGIRTIAASVALVPFSVAVQASGLDVQLHHEDRAAVDSVADAPTAVAAASAPAAARSGAELQEVQVTGTRIIRNGYEAPTPVTVVGLQQLQDQAAPNYADVLNDMPQFQGSARPESTGTSDGPNGGANNLNLRGLGSNRVLVLFDGRRYPAESNSNVVDVNMLPDALVQRVDVVTGGASAVYGSDAVVGVVNYVLDTNFNGIKGLLQGGISGYGDGANDKIQLTGGMPFAGGRGHIEVSADQQYQAEIEGTERAWNMTGYYWMTNPATRRPMASRRWFRTIRSRRSGPARAA